MKAVMVFLALLLCTEFVLSLRKGPQKCRIMALEGGGTKGAYQAGVFEAMVKLLKPEDVAYDVMTGASVGALNGLMFAAHEKGAEVEVAHKMTQLWKTVEQGSIFQHWPILGPILGLISKTSFFDNSPELPYLRTRLQAEGGQIKRRMTIGIADAQTGDYLIINSSTGAKDWPYYIVGSSSVPGFFVPMIVGNRVWIDGGTLNNLNLRGGIAECLDIGAAVEDIVIDVVMTNPFDAPYYDMSEAKTYDVYQRGTELGKIMETMYYLFTTMRAFPTIEWRYIVIPKESLPNYPGLALSFDRDTLQKEWDIGLKDGTNVINDGKHNLQTYRNRRRLDMVRRIKLA